MIGNHVVIRSDGGNYAVVAHLKQRSLAVTVGDRIGAGALVGYCGNSGNSSEPHVHAQLMDRASFWTGHGIPMSFSNITIGAGTTGTAKTFPENGEHLITQSESTWVGNSAG